MTETIMPTYSKIYGPFKRETQGPSKNQLIVGAWNYPEFELLQDFMWTWTEKVDGTNIRIHWDGHRVTFGGRTDNAQIPAFLLARLQEMFPEELFEQTFEDKAVTLFGEGYGNKIQKVGSLYRPDSVDFVLFDVKRTNWFSRDAVEEVATQLGVDVVPLIFTTSVWDAMLEVADGLSSYWGDFPVEGLVGIPKGGLLASNGSRIQMKVKTVDFAHEQLREQLHRADQERGAYLR